MYVVASALAEATAIAISEVYVSCEADDGAYACADASTFIEDAAHTVAAVRPPSPCQACKPETLHVPVTGVHELFKLLPVTLLYLLPR